MSAYETSEVSSPIRIDAEVFSQPGSDLENSTIQYIDFNIDYTVTAYKDNESIQVYEYDLKDVSITGTSNNESLSESDKVRIITKIAEMFNANADEFLYEYARDNAITAEYSNLEDLIKTAETQSSNEYIDLPGIAAKISISLGFVKDQVSGVLTNYGGNTGVQVFKSLYTEDGEDNSSDWENFRELRNMIMEYIISAVQSKLNELDSTDGIVKMNVKSINADNLWQSDSSLYDIVEDLMHEYIKSHL